VYEWAPSTKEGCLFVLFIGFVCYVEIAQMRAPPHSLRGAPADGLVVSSYCMQMSIISKLSQET
jgi:hypothetical protein